MLDPTTLHRHFPALKDDFIFADNAGGSQCLQGCVDNVVDYLLKSNVQMGAGYPIGVKSEKAVAKGFEAAATFINAASPKDVVFGSSTTALFANLATALRLGGSIKPDDEIVVCEADHEANVGPWVRLAREVGCDLKVWQVTGDLAGGANLELSKLEAVVGPKTKVVAFTACSNILGQYTPIRDVVDLVARCSEGRAKTVLDCVAYAPHAKLDVQAWGVDFLGFSYYKVFAPHVSLLYVAPTANDVLDSLGHYFHPSAPSYKLAPGGASYELICATAAVLPYVASLSGLSESASIQDRLSSGWAAVQKHEQLLGEKLLDYLTSNSSRLKGVRVIGPQGMGTDRGRSAVTVSFVVLAKDSVEPTGQGPIKKRLQSKEIVQRFDQSGKAGIKYGHFYATRLLAALGMGTVEEPCSDGVVRISLVHYTTLEQVERLIAMLEEVL